jgi:hypothetical protein
MILSAIYIEEHYLFNDPQIQILEVDLTSWQFNSKKRKRRLHKVNFYNEETIAFS